MIGTGGSLIEAARAYSDAGAVAIDGSDPWASPAIR